MNIKKIYILLSLLAFNSIANITFAMESKSVEISPDGYFKLNFNTDNDANNNYYYFGFFPGQKYVSKIFINFDLQKKILEFIKKLFKNNSKLLLNSGSSNNNNQVSTINNFTDILKALGIKFVYLPKTLKKNKTIIITPEIFNQILKLNPSIELALKNLFNIDRELLFGKNKSSGLNKLLGNKKQGFHKDITKLLLDNGAMLDSVDNESKIEEIHDEIDNNNVNSIVDVPALIDLPSDNIDSKKKLDNNLDVPASIVLPNDNKEVPNVINDIIPVQPNNTDISLPDNNKQKNIDDSKKSGVISLLKNVNLFDVLKSNRAYIAGASLLVASGYAAKYLYKNYKRANLIRNKSSIELLSDLMYSFNNKQRDQIKDFALIFSTGVNSRESIITLKNNYAKILNEEQKFLIDSILAQYNKEVGLIRA